MSYCYEYNSLQGCSKKECKNIHKYISSKYKTRCCIYAGPQHYYKCMYQNRCIYAINNKEYYKWNMLNLYKEDLEKKCLIRNGDQKNWAYIYKKRYLSPVIKNNKMELKYQAFQVMFEAGYLIEYELLQRYLYEWIRTFTVKDYRYKLLFSIEYNYLYYKCRVLQNMLLNNYYTEDIKILCKNYLKHYYNNIKYDMIDIHSIKNI
jgi:hypothetical protein